MPGQFSTEPGNLSYEYFSKRVHVNLSFLFQKEKKYNTSTYKFVSRVKEQICYYQEISENHMDDGDLCTSGDSPWPEKSMSIEKKRKEIGNIFGDYEFLIRGGVSLKK